MFGGSGDQAGNRAVKVGEGGGTFQVGKSSVLVWGLSFTAVSDIDILLPLYFWGLFEVLPEGILRVEGLAWGVPQTEDPP